MTYDPMFPVTYSILDPAALLEEVRRSYPLPEPLEYRRLYLGVNDTYFLAAAGTPLILRAYRAQSRPPPRVAFELDLIERLVTTGVPVARPIHRSDGRYSTTLAAPEGGRELVLFEFAPGGPPLRDETAAERYGGALAALHTALDGLEPTPAAPMLDLRALLDCPLEQLTSVLTHRPADLAFLAEMADLVRSYVEANAAFLDWGACHGDFQWKNAHVDDAGTVTVFDLDGAGFGWRAHDLAVFRPLSGDAAIWSGFLRGYTRKRTLSQADLAAVPYFEAAIRLWSLGFFLEHRDSTAWGSDAVNDALFNREVALLRRWWPRLTAR